MTDSWAEGFAEQQSESILDGTTEIRSIWRTEVAANSTVKVVRKRSTAPRPQAIVIDSDAEMRVGDISARRFIIWSDNSPEEVDIVCPDGGQLRVWNAWRNSDDPDDFIHAWLGNAGMVAVSVDQSVTIGFSDGHEPADITKFIVELTID